MKKRVLSLFMTLMLCLTSLPTTSFAEELAVANGTTTAEAVKAEAGAETGKSGEAEAGAEAGKDGGVAEAEAGKDGEAEAEAGKDGESEAGAESGKSGEAEAGAESGKSGEAKVEAGAETGKDGEVEAGAEAGKSGEAKVEAGAGKDGVAEAESGKGGVAEAETGKDGEAEAGDEAEEAGAESATGEAVASVQDMIDALPDAGALSAMDEDEVLAAYMAVQAAYDAYEALTVEQQAQITGADCFEELFGWFNGQVAPLADGKVTSYGTVDETTGDFKQLTDMELTCDIVNDGTTVLAAEHLYMIQDNENVTLTSLTVQGNTRLFLGKNATLTINDPLTFQNGSRLSVYGASDESGEIIINNKDATSAAIQADNGSNGSTFYVCSGTLKITSTSGHITNGVKLVNGNSSLCRYMEYEIDGEPVAYNENKDRLSGTAIDGKNLTLEWCGHDEATYERSDDTQHIKKCAKCGFEGAASDCVTDNYIGGYKSDGPDGHYPQCVCGNRIGTDTEKHSMGYKPTSDGRQHITGCGSCDYSTGTPEEHTFEQDEYGFVKCTECGFAPVAQDSDDALYQSVTEALEAVANGNGAKYVQLYSPVEGVKKINAKVAFGHSGAEVELQMNEHSLTSSSGSTLTVEDGTLRVTGDATINQTGNFPDIAASAIKVSGGKLIFVGTLNAEGGLADETRRPAVEANGGELEFNGDLDLNGGLVLSGDAKLTEKLTKGTFQAEDDTSSARVSVVGSNEYNNVYELLQEGYGFKDSSTGKFVGGGDDVKTLTEDVTIAAHEHSYTAVEGKKYWQCECGKTCSHEGGYMGGACSVCGKPCLHEQVTTEDYETICDYCGLQMVVRIVKPNPEPSQSKPITTYSADFKSTMYAAENDTTITLLADIEQNSWDRPSVYGNDKTVTLNLNRHTISNGFIDVAYAFDTIPYTSSTLKITGNGSIYGGITVWPKATLDLSEWTGSTISRIFIYDDSSVDATEKAGLKIGANAGKIQELQFGSNASPQRMNIELSGGSYDKIWAINCKAPLQLGNLLEAGYAFQYIDDESDVKTYVDYTKTLENASVDNVKVVKCPHEEVKDGICAYCGTTGIVATLDGEAYTDIETAVTAWLSNGGLLKLYSNYPYNKNIDFYQAEGKSLTIDLNGYQFNVNKDAIPKDLMGAYLTIMDTSEDRDGVFGKLNAQEGKLTLESGTLEELSSTINYRQPSSPVTISLHGGKFHAGTISYRTYKMLDGGYYLLEDNSPVNPGNESYSDNTKWRFQDDSLYEVKKADITVDGAKAGEIEIGKNQVPIAATVKVNDENIEKVLFQWYLVKAEDGSLAKLAESSYVTLTDGTATYDVTTDGSAYAEESWNDVVRDTTYDLICVVTGSTGDKVQWHTVWNGYQMTITQVNLDSEETEITQKEGSGNAQEGGNRLVVQPFSAYANVLYEVTYQFDVTYGGKPLKLGEDYTIKDKSNVAMDAGEHELTIIGAGNYKGEKTVKWEIEPYVLGKHAATQITKEYDGTATADESVHGVSGLGIFVIDSSNLRNPELDNIPNISLSEDDFVITDMHFDSAEAGDRTFYFTLELKNNNFVLEDGKRTAEFKLRQEAGGGAVSIDKKNGVTASEAKDLSVVNGHAATYTVDLAGMLPKLDAPMEYGDVRYELDPVTLDSQYYASGASIEGSKLILPILESQLTGDQDVGTITVKVISNNINDFSLTINVKATDKIVPTGTPTLSKTAITYGEALSTITLSGSMTDPGTDETVTGTFEWVSPDKTMDAVGTYEAAWKFTPDNAGFYAEVTDTVTITVEKATPAGAPKYTTISASGRKLSDAALTVNDNWPAGTLEWVDDKGNVLPGDTEVKVNTIYKWRFTPKDSNYNTVDGEVELYHVDAPAINTQPVNASVKAGERAVFEVAATGTDLTYQWKINRNDGNGFVDISGANSASYTSGVTDTDCNGFQYYCVISNAAGSVTTDTVTLTVTVEYEILDGAGSSWTENTDGSLAIRGSGAISKFLRVLVDGTVVDPSNYTVTEGSTIITFKPEFLKTLPEGSHTFELVWTDGTASTSFTVAKNTSGNNGGNNNNNNNSNNDSSNNTGSGANTAVIADTAVKAPKTGDTLNDTLWIVLLAVASIAGAAQLLTFRKKKDL